LSDPRASDLRAPRPGSGRGRPPGATRSARGGSPEPGPPGGPSSGSSPTDGGRARPADVPPRLGADAATWLLLPVRLLLGLFLLAPLAALLLVSLATRGPYGGVVVPPLAEHLLGGGFLANYLRSFEPLYLGIAWRSFSLALLTTGLCLLAAFPAAWFLARVARPRHRPWLLALVVLPFWTSFLVRAYAWMTLLRDEGLLNRLFVGAGWVEAPLAMLYTPGAVLVGLVYGELPYMILPLWAVFERLDGELLTAAADLGAPRHEVLRRVVLPLAWPGIVAGSVLVFVPSLGQFVISDLLGGARAMLLGNLVQNQVAIARNLPFAAALAIELAAFVLALGWCARRLTRGGGDATPTRREELS
jgi:spermidine/putrescine transport system permease protein